MPILIALFLSTANATKIAEQPKFYLWQPLPCGQYLRYELPIKRRMTLNYLASPRPLIAGRRDPNVVDMLSNILPESVDVKPEHDSQKIIADRIEFKLRKRNPMLAVTLKKAGEIVATLTMNRQHPDLGPAVLEVQDKGEEYVVHLGPDVGAMYNGRSLRKFDEPVVPVFTWKFTKYGFLKSMQIMVLDKTKSYEPVWVENSYFTPVGK